MFIAAFITSSLALKIQNSARQSVQTASRTELLFETNKLLQKAATAQEAAETASRQLAKLLERDVKRRRYRKRSTFQEENHWIVIEIADQGNGIPDEEKQKIFDMFYTAPTRIADSRRSMGIGLALSRSIVHSHGGKINVYDNQPSGAIFRFMLPAEEVKLDESVQYSNRRR